jgi:hypothetical protein
VRPGEGEVLHFSEDPSITRFEPRREAIHSTVAFSGIRLRNASPDPTGRLSSDTGR